MDASNLPDEYKMLFNSIEWKGNQAFADYTGWVYVPAPRLVITPLLAPGDSEFWPGDNKTIRIQVDSSDGGFQPRVKLFANNQSGMILRITNV